MTFAFRRAIDRKLTQYTPAAVEAVLSHFTHGRAPQRAWFLIPYSDRQA